MKSICIKSFIIFLSYFCHVSSVEYTVEKLTDLNNTFIAVSLNDNETIVGNRAGINESKFLIWDRKNGTREIETQIGGVVVEGINNQNHVFGVEQFKGFIWDDAEGFFHISDLPISQSIHLNNRDEALVTVFSPDVKADFYFLKNKTNVIPLNFEELRNDSCWFSPINFNDKGQALISIYKKENGAQGWAVLDQDQIIKFNKPKNTRPIKINNQGDVLLAKDTINKKTKVQKTVLSIAKANNDRITVKSPYHLSPNHMNDQQEVIGNFEKDGDWWPFVWTPTEGFQDLSNLVLQQFNLETAVGDHKFSATAIALNNRGQILLLGYDFIYQKEQDFFLVNDQIYFLLTPKNN